MSLFLRVYANVYPENRKGAARVIAFSKQVHAAGHGVVEKQADALPVVLIDADTFDEFMSALQDVDKNLTIYGEVGADTWNKLRAISSRMKVKAP